MIDNTLSFASSQDLTLYLTWNLTPDLTPDCAQFLAQELTIHKEQSTKKREEEEGDAGFPRKLIISCNDETDLKTMISWKDRII